MTKGSYLADLVTVIGTQDLVFEKLIDKLFYLFTISILFKDNEILFF